MTDHAAEGQQDERMRGLARECSWLCMSDGNAHYYPEPASETPGPGEGDLRGEVEYPRQRKGLNPFLPDAPVRKTFTDERVIEAAESWSADQRMREGWRDGDMNTYRYRANLLDALCVRLLAAVEQRTLAEQKVARVEEATAERIAEALWVARRDVTGPDTFYAGMIHAVRIACPHEHLGTHGERAAALADPEADR